MVTSQRTVTRERKHSANGDTIFSLGNIGWTSKSITLPHPMITTSSSSEMRDLAQHNSQALLLLWEGREDEAMSVLRGSILRAKSLLTGTRTRQTNVRLEAISFQGVMNPDDHSICDDNFFAMYRHVFVVAPESASSALPICAVSNYNLALLHHEAALDLGDDWEQLAYARSLYESSLSFVSSFKKEAFFNEEASSCLAELELACYTNLGHLFALLGDAEGIFFCRAGLGMALESGRAHMKIASFAFFRRSLELASMYQGGTAAAA